MSDPIIISVITGVFGIITTYIAVKNAKKKEERKKEEVIKLEMDKSVPIEIPCDSVIILVLDDDKDQLMLTKRIINGMGLECELFHEEGPLLKRMPIAASIYIIDHYLREMYGWDIVNEVQHKNRNNVIIIYSGIENKYTIDEYHRKKVSVVYKDDPDSRIILEALIRKGIAHIKESV